MKEGILKYKMKYQTKDSLKWHLTILCDLLSFSRENIKPYLIEIHAIIVYSLLHNEKDINKRGIHVVTIIIHSLMDLYPLDLKTY